MIIQKKSDPYGTLPGGHFRHAVMIPMDGVYVAPEQSAFRNTIITGRYE